MDDSCQIRKAVQKRDRLLKTYSKSVNHRPTSWDCYRVQRNLVVSLVRKAKINYNTKTNQALSDPAISSKKWWCITKSIYDNKCYSAILAFFEGDFFISDPKGSILGPLLSLLYINDFPLSVSCSTELFADDSVLYRKIASVDNCVEFQDDLLSAASWCDLWKVKLKSEKCKALHVTKSNCPLVHQYVLNENNLSAVDKHKHLGIWIESSLRWEAHINYIVGKAN